MIIIPKGESTKPKKDRQATRPADEVFSGKVESAYKSFVGLADKVAVLSRHRAVKNSQSNGAKLNRFIARMSETLNGYQVVPGQAAEAEEEESLSDFLKA